MSVTCIACGRPIADGKARRFLPGGGQLHTTCGHAMRYTELGVTPELRGGMLARVHVSPTATNETRLTFLTGVLQLLVAVNRAWLREQLAAAKHPPLSVHLAAPPWTAAPVQYVPHHGEPLARDRDYQDGPTLFHTGRATCIDIAAYDAAALLEIVQVNARAVIVGAWPSMHAVLLVRRDDGTEAQLDPTRQWEASDDATQ